ncbi:MAG: hypothetical protein C5B51_25145 [Terriglobia bacterium]|nr:MAG: hypothetical protein C5B51_25145 [Terriglobia bacterium]
MSLLSHLLLPLLASCVIAQTADDSRPAPSNLRGSQYPRVYPDNRVTFRLKAPEARNVQVQPTPGAVDNGLGKGPYDMVRDKDGVWSVTIPPAVPGLHIYHILVDGFPVDDPGSELYFNGNRLTSGVEVPENGVDYYLPRDVPHGAVQEIWYHSKVTGTWRRTFVYTPPDYDRQTSTRYPVLYLQHGGSEDETSWLRMGKANFIMDNLLADKKAVPMLVVMENGYASRAGETRQQAADPNQPTAFEDLMIQDLIPMIDARYRTRPDRESRAIRRPIDGRQPSAHHRPRLPRQVRVHRRFQRRLPRARLSAGNLQPRRLPEARDTQFAAQGFICRHRHCGTLLSIPEAVPREVE